jgi:hypothetical protein
LVEIVIVFDACKVFSLCNEKTVKNPGRDD